MRARIHRLMLHSRHTWVRQPSASVIKFLCAGRELRIRSHPLPLTQEESLTLDTVLSVLAAIFVLIPFCYLSGALIHKQQFS